MELKSIERRLCFVVDAASLILEHARSTGAHVHEVEVANAATEEAWAVVESCVQ